MSAAEKVGEAEKIYKEGKKFASKTLTRWKPDWDNASMCFEKAALMFKNAKAFERAIDAYTCAGDANEQANLCAAAGRAYENAGMCCKDSGDVERMANLFKRAAVQYRLDSKADKGGELLKRAAQALEKKDPDRAAELYKDSLGYYLDEDKHHLAAESFRWMVTMYIKQEKFKEAADAFGSQIPVFIKLDQQHNVGKCLLSQVILALRIGDVGMADKFIRDAGSVEGSDAMRQQEYDVAVELVQAFEEGDEEKLKKLRADQVISFLENEVARVGKNLAFGPHVKKAGLKFGNDDERVVADELDDNNLL